MDAEFATSALVTLLVTVDPIGLAPIFLSVTPSMTGRERTHVAVRASIIAFVILAFFAVAGDMVLHLLGIGLPAFQIAGGLLLFWIAFEMVFELRNDRKQHTAKVAVTQDHIRNIAAFPLAIPLMAGPGAITATILLAGRTTGDAAGLLTLIALLALVMLAGLAVFFTAERLSRLLGVTGNIVLSRLLGIILASLAVQFVVTGGKAVVGPP
jgi:multiple antibiotic resistance protein